MSTQIVTVPAQSIYGVYPVTTYRMNPIVRSVQGVFDGIYAQVASFVQHPNSAINGMVVHGDAGTGKTYTVKKALRDTGHQQNTEYIKGAKITAASLYVKLYLNRHKHRIIVLDDCDLIHHQEKNLIVPMLLGAADLGPTRDVGWETARKNPLMQEHGVPHNFPFQGRIIWITNDRKADIGSKIKQWKNAIFSRFNFASCTFTDQEKYLYTMHLVENLAMLGKNCQEFTGGYPASIIEQAADYMSNNYAQLTEVTPRIAIKIADTLHHNPDPDLRAVMLRQLWK